MLTNPYVPLLSAISQSHLNLWHSCQRRFQHYFLECLTAPAATEQYKRLELGARFHLLMQQKELGLEITDLANSDRNLQKWLLAFETNPPKVIMGDRYSEHRRTLELPITINPVGENHLNLTYIITVIYDLLVLGNQSAQILDWKTHQHPQAIASLQVNWQTKLYLYVLAETSGYAPEQLSMSYWFANTGSAVTITYNNQQHQQTDQELREVLEAIAQAQQMQHFIQLPLNHQECHRCDFAYRCGRIETEQNMSVSNLTAVHTYPEIAI